MPDASETCDTKGNHYAFCALDSSFFLPILLTFVSESATSINFSTIFAISGFNLPSLTSSLTLSCRSLCACLLPQLAQIVREKKGKHWGICSPEISYMLACACACLGASKLTPALRSPRFPQKHVAHCCHLLLLHLWE